MSNERMIVFVLTAALVLLVKFLLQKRERCQYDERQMAARGDAFRAAYLTLLIYLVVVFEFLQDVVWCDRATGVFLGVILSLGVFAVVCVLKDAYFSVSGISRPQIAVLVIVGALNLANGIRHVVIGDLIQEGILTFNGTSNLLCGLLFVALGTTLLAKSALDKGESDDEES